MMSELLGTTWWTLLCFGTGFCFGVLMANKVKALLGR